jgi:hypothetical protein
MRSSQEDPGVYMLECTSGALPRFVFLSDEDYAIELFLVDLGIEKADIRYTLPILTPSRNRVRWERALDGASIIGRVFIAPFSAFDNTFIFRVGMQRVFALDPRPTDIDSLLRSYVLAPFRWQVDASFLDDLDLAQRLGMWQCRAAAAVLKGLQRSGKFGTQQTLPILATIPRTDLDVYKVRSDKLIN